jgi:hypothetical protein
MEKALFCVPTYMASDLSQLKLFIFKYCEFEHREREREREREMRIFVVAKDPSVPL